MSGPARAPAPARDPGLQPERTRLAWRRTALSGSVAAVLALKSALASGQALVMAGCALAWLGLLVLAQVRTGQLRARRPVVLRGVRATLCVVCVLVLALCAAVVVL